MHSTNDSVQRLLQDLGRALTDAIADSDDVTNVVRRIRDRGFALNLILDCQQDADATKAQVELTRRSDEPPTFRLHGEDVAMLKSMGIDATRPAPRRRR